ncbi:hypothetical protein DPMN_156684, partial [Dreissena polymorpha]
RVRGLSGVIFSCYLECRGCHKALLVLPCSANVGRRMLRSICYTTAVGVFTS